MLKRVFRIEVCFLAATLVVATLSSRDSSAEATIGDHLMKPSLNVVITVSDMEAMQKFYGEVMGLETMSPIPFPPNTQEVFFPTAIVMQRFKVGTHEIKLIPGVESTKKYPGGIDKAIGFRMVNYPITDIDAFKARLAKHGYPEPEIQSMEGSNYRFGLLEDPDGNTVEFYYYDGEGPEGWEETIHIALTVSDVEASRVFYGEQLGLEELPAVPMPSGDRTVHLFRSGPTIIKFWSYGKDLPNRAGRHKEAYGYRYIQYATKNLNQTFDFVEGQGATVEMPPTPITPKGPIAITFIADPDGIVNEMFGVWKAE